MTMQHIPHAVWEEYVKGRSPELRQELALKYLGLVRYVVVKYRAAFANAAGMLEAKDLEQVGALGLLEAIERYDPMLGVRFETYAVTRIRGAIQDELRRLDWVPRSVRRKAREAAQSTADVGMFFNRGDKHMQTSHDTKDATEETMSATAGNVCAVENLPADTDPLEEAVNNQLKTLLIRLVEKLPADERLIITLYYYEELTFKEIGTILKVSESRVSQKHSSVMKKLRKRLGGTS